MFDDRPPGVSGIGRRVDLSPCCAEVDAAGIERVDRHRVAQHVDVAVALRQSLRERLPLVAAGAAAVHAQLAIGRVVLGVALARHHVDRLGLVRVHVDRKSEVGRQVSADLAPRLAGIVAAHDVPVLLHEQHARAGAVPRDAVHAVTDLGRRVRNLLGAQAAIHRPPRLAAIARALDHLTEPTARLRPVEAIGIGGRSLEVIDLPAAEMRTAHVPALACAVRGQNERALAGADEYTYPTHASLLPASKFALPTILHLTAMRSPTGPRLLTWVRRPSRDGLRRYSCAPAERARRRRALRRDP